MHIDVGGVRYGLFDLPAFARDARVDLACIPFVGRVILESMMRSGEHAAALACAQRLASGNDAGVEIAFRPARLLLQDYTAVPTLVDLAAMRDRVHELGADATRVNPVVPTDVVVDHSLQVDAAGERSALAFNEAQEMRRNRERYEFLRWAEQAFDNLRVFPPGQGIVHQVNLERLASVVVAQTASHGQVLVPDSVIGTDSHTTMVNGLGVLGWGVGGLEAEAILLGLPVRTWLPPIVGVHLRNRLRPGVSATDVVLALTEFLRSAGVVGACLEFMGAATLAAPDRCTIANMAPEYGAMCAFFPVDAETLRYLRQTGRSDADVERVEAYCRRQGLYRDDGAPLPKFGRVLDFDLSRVEPCVAGPSTPHQRVPLSRLPQSFEPRADSTSASLKDGSIVIASITSCTSTSNPASMVAAGLLAQKAAARGLVVPPHVKTSFAPGSPAVTRYLGAARLLEPLEALGFHVVGYGCATCNGGGGELKPGVSETIDREGTRVASVLSGNRNFEGRIHPRVRANYLASPALVVALAIAGNVNIDLEREPLGIGRDGKPVFLADVWPDDEAIAAVVSREVGPDVFRVEQQPSASWHSLAVESGPRYAWKDDSTYIRKPPYFESRDFTTEIVDARALVVLGDDVTTDHISPVGAIAESSPAGQYLSARGVTRAAFNSHGSRRGNHEVMARATFANVRVRNRLVDVEGGVTIHLPSGDQLSIYEAASRYAAERTPLIVIAGRNYGMGSSRDWAARGPWFLGIRAVLAESFERIHRANLVAMGILPVELTAPLLGRRERFTLESEGALSPRGRVRIRARNDAGEETVSFGTARIDSDAELAIYRRGGMLPHLLENFSTRALA